MRNKYPQDNCDCYILNDLPEKTEFTKYPSEYWVLHLYIIVLEQKKSEQYPLLNNGKFLVLEHPSYADHSKSIWSTPYLAYRIDVGTKRYNRVCDIKRMYDNQCKIKDELLTELTNYRFYHMGISTYDFEDGREYIEYKRSPRQPDIWKCYFIRERFVYNIDSLGLQNLIDPEGLHAYSYYPIINGITANKLYGKPMSTNVKYLFQDGYLLRKAKITQIDLCEFKTRFKGYIFKFDIVSFTNTVHGIEGNYKSFEKSGTQYSDEFIIYLQHIFEQELANAKISQYRLEGDGFLASIEASVVDPNIEESIIDVFKTIAIKISKLLRENILSFRTSLIFGEYDYGKELGLFSKGLAHSGKELIRITRMDCAIKEHLHSRTYSEPMLFFLIDSAICNNERLPYDGTLNFITYIDGFRETAINGNLYSIKMEEII